MSISVYHLFVEQAVWRFLVSWYGIKQMEDELGSRERRRLSVVILRVVVLIRCIKNSFKISSDIAFAIDEETKVVCAA